MNIEPLMVEIMNALPNRSRRGSLTVREVCLNVSDDRWSVRAGGHHAISLGEYEGDYQGEGATPQEALTTCLKAIKMENR